MAPYYVIKSYAAKQNFISRHSSELMWSQDNSKADVYTEADIIIKKDDKEIKITFGSAEFEVNGEKFTYEAPIETVYDRTMVPVRAISEAFGKIVFWDGENELIVISDVDLELDSDEDADYYNDYGAFTEWAKRYL